MNGYVYAIVNTMNGMAYIGSTKNPVPTRFTAHRAALRGGYHHNDMLQRDWITMGEHRFRFEILMVVPSLSVLLLSEFAWIGVFEETGSGLYNVFRVPPDTTSEVYYGR